MADQRMDRRVQRTQKLLQDALIALILEKGYEKITVQNIIDKANVGRSTFYAHYQDKDDLMASSMEPLYADLRQHFAPGSGEHPPDAMMSGLILFQHTGGQYHLYKAMLGGRGIEIVNEAIRDSLTANARAHFEQMELAGKRLTIPMEVLIIHVAGSLQTLLTWWLDNGMPYSPKRMNEMFIQLTSGGVEAVIED